MESRRFIETVPTDGAGGNGALSLYIYAVGSLFEDILNQYMITSKPVHPPELLKTGAYGSLLWETANGSSEALLSADVRLLQNLQERSTPVIKHVSDHQPYGRNSLH